MRFEHKKKHTIDILFPIALFFVFAASALTTILFAAKSYRSAAENAQAHDTSRIPLAYISEKIRQNDACGAVSIGSFEGRDSLIFKQEINDRIYKTYIYEYEGVLKELFVKDGTYPPPESGKDIIAVNGFSIKKLSDSLFEFTTINEAGTSDSITIGIRSQHGEAMP